MRNINKPNGHCLSRAVFSGLKRKLALKDLNTDNKLIRSCITELINDIENLYSPWLSDSIKSIPEADLGCATSKMERFVIIVNGH